MLFAFAIANAQPAEEPIVTAEAPLESFAYDMPADGLSRYVVPVTVDPVNEVMNELALVSTLSTLPASESPETKFKLVVVTPVFERVAVVEPSVPAYQVAPAAVCLPTVGKLADDALVKIIKPPAEAVDVNL